MLDQDLFKQGISLLNEYFHSSNPVGTQYKKKNQRTIKQTQCYFKCTNEHGTYEEILLNAILRVAL